MEESIRNLLGKLDNNESIELNELEVLKFYFEGEIKLVADSIFLYPEDETLYEFKVLQYEEILTEINSLIEMNRKS